MTFFPVYLFLFSFAFFMGLVWVLNQARRRRGSLKVRHYAFPLLWLRILERNVPFYTRMPLDLRPALQDQIVNFIDSRKWKACGGLDAVTDEMKVTIAADACLLSLNRRGETNFARVLCVLVFPANASAEESEPPPDGWPPGSAGVIWDAERKSVRDWRDPELRGLRETEERLGVEAGTAGGGAEEGRHYIWGRILGHELARSAAGAGAAESPGGGEISARLLEESGPQEPPEFLGGVTDLFFRRPDRLLARRPDIYRLLLEFYHLDPARWKPAR